MSTKSSRSVANQPNIKAAKIATLGKTFSDGSLIDVLRDPVSGRLRVLVSTGANRTVARVVEFRGAAYRPRLDHRSILSGVRFPTAVGGFGSTRKLFTALRQQFLKYGFPAKAIVPLPYFVFSTWFPEAMPAVPSLLVTGPPAECEFVMQLLHCMVRRPLRLGAIAPNTLWSLPEGLCPTLLLNQSGMTNTVAQILGASRSRNVQFLRSDKLVSLSSPTIIYCGLTVQANLFSDSLLRVDIPPSRGHLLILDAIEQQEIATVFQSQLLSYRCQHFTDVCDSTCDFPEFDSPIRILGRILGKPIVKLPEVQASLEPLLRNLQEDAQASRAYDLHCVTIEALLHHVHKDPGQKIHVGDLTDTIMRILKLRGQVREIEPEVVGRILRRDGFAARRDARGFSLRLDESVCVRIHELAHRFSVSAVYYGIEKCRYCKSTHGEPAEAK